MDAQQFEILSKKLDTIILLLSADKLQGDKNDSILLLSGMGLDNQTIAAMLSTSANYVAVVKSTQGKEVKKSKKPNKTRVAETQDGNSDGQLGGGEQ